MPSLSVHLLIGLSLFLLCYLTTRDLLSSFFSLICAVIPDADALFGVHRCFIVHNFMIPIVMIIISIVLKFLRRINLSRIFLWSGIGYLSHILFDMFTWYVAIFYPISNLCVWVRGIISYRGGLSAGASFNLSFTSCSSLPTHVPSMSDKILIPVAVFVLLIVILTVVYELRRRSHNYTS
ncbi:MAG: hypothetical protein GXO26_00630 [Crenarchaeota archaeon]|nr:hypothetical protein [Thermoproteota archaeon]